MKKYILLLALIIPAYAGAAEFPIVNHVEQCGDGSRQMTDAEMSVMLQCIIEQRDAMGHMMGAWKKYSLEAKESCLVTADRGDRPVDYVVLRKCLLQTG